MSHPLTRFLTAFAVSSITLFLLSATAAASALQDFNEAVAEAYAHHRRAVFELAQEDLDDAEKAVNSMRKAWSSVRRKFRGDPPDAYSEEPEWDSILDFVAEQIDAAKASLDDGASEETQVLLFNISSTLANLRRRNGLFVFSDCIDEIERAIEDLSFLRDDLPQFADTEATDRFKGQLAVTDYLFSRCGDRASESLKEDPDFNRALDDIRFVMDLLHAAARGGDRAQIGKLVDRLMGLAADFIIRFG